jgi:hypothetical protein
MAKTTRKKSKKNSSKKRWLLVALCAFFAIAIVVFIFKYSHDTPGRSSAVNQGPTPAERKAEADANLDAKKSAIESKNTSSAGDTESGNSSSSGDQSIQLSAKQDNQNTVTVFTKLYGITGGNCSLSITNGNNTYSDTADVIYQPEYSSCAGFSVPTSGLGMGAWSITLTVNSASQTINFTVN